MNDAAGNNPDLEIVYLRLDGNEPVSHATIDRINHVCDQAGNAGPAAVLVVEIHDDSRNSHTHHFAGQTNTRLVSQWERALRRIEKLAIPTLCVVKVNCFGAMLDILLTTDYRIASSHSQMGLAKMGDSIWPGMVVHRLTTQLGVANARSLVLFGSHVNAERARELGLINAITADSLSSSQSFVQSLNFAHIQDIAMRRSLLFEAPASTYEDALGTHLAACDRALRRQVTATPHEDALDTVA